MNASPDAARRGRLFVVAAPSGAGKTSLVKALLERRPGLKLSISHTTRSRRPTETEGRDYFFVTREQFARLKSEDRFLEDAEVFDNHYGTSREQVESTLDAGRDVVLEIDWQGAQQVRARMPEAISIFVLPPSRAALEARLRARGTDSDQVIARRLADAAGDMSHWREFDYVIVNDDLVDAVAQVAAILEVESRRVSRIANLPEVVEHLRNGVAGTISRGV